VQITEGKSDGMACMQHTCPEIVVSPEWLKGLIEDDLLDKFMVFWVNLYVEVNPTWQSCQRPDCKYLVRADGARENIRCRCGFATCPRCPYEAHEPATCHEIEKWKLKTEADSENF
jgi:hypothetical protein